MSEDIHSRIMRAQTRPSVTQVLERMQPDIAKAIPKGLDPERVSRIALTLIRTSEMAKAKGISKTSLAECTPESFAGALLTTVALGLEPGIGGEAYLIPYRDRRAGTVECQLIVGYQGLVRLFRQHPAAMHIGAQTVYSNDFFEYAHGSDAYLRHRPAAGDRGEVVAYYADAKLVNGAYEFVVLSPDEVKALRAGKVGPSGDIADPMRWMERKTALRQLLKTLPKSTELVTAMDADEQPGSTLVRQIPTPVTPAPAIDGQQFEISRDQSGQVEERVDLATGEVLGPEPDQGDFPVPPREPQPQQGQQPAKKAAARSAGRKKTSSVNDDRGDDDAPGLARPEPGESRAGQEVRAGRPMSGDEPAGPAAAGSERGAGGGADSGAEVVDAAAGDGQQDRITVKQRSLLMGRWSALSMMEDRDERLLVTNILLGLEPGTVASTADLSMEQASELIGVLVSVQSRDGLDQLLAGQSTLDGPA